MTCSWLFRVRAISRPSHSLSRTAFKHTSNTVQLTSSTVYKHSLAKLFYEYSVSLTDNLHMSHMQDRASLLASMHEVGSALKQAA
jgi:hypothetical protein